METKAFDALDDRALVIVLDKKPKSQDRSLTARGGVPFTVTKLAYIRMTENEPGRYELKEEYKSADQLKALTSAPSVAARIRPEIKHIDKSGLKPGSMGETAQDAIKEISDLETKEEVEAYVLGDERKTIIAAAEAQVASFITKAEEPKDTADGTDRTKVK